MSLNSLVRSKEQLQVANEITLSSIKGLMGRMATILNIVFIMGKLSPHYDYGFRQTTLLLLTIYEQLGRSLYWLKTCCCMIVFMCVFRALQTEDVTANLTVIAHNHFIHGYFENEKLIFSLLLALEVCNNNNNTLFSVFSYLCTVSQLESLDGRVLKNEREFLISPFPGTKYIIRGLTYQHCTSENAPVLNFGKRPFDWMTEEQWQSLLVCIYCICTVHVLVLCDWCVDVGISFFMDS